MLVGLLQEFPVISQVFLEFASVLTFRECGELSYRLGKYNYLPLLLRMKGVGLWNVHRGGVRLRHAVQVEMARMRVRHYYVTIDINLRTEHSETKKCMMKYRLLGSAKAKGFGRWGWGGGRPR